MRQVFRQERRTHRVAHRIDARVRLVLVNVLQSELQIVHDVTADETRRFHFRQIGSWVDQHRHSPTLTIRAIHQVHQVATHRVTRDAWQHKQDRRILFCRFRFKPIYVQHGAIICFHLLSSVRMRMASKEGRQNRQEISSWKPRRAKIAAVNVLALRQNGLMEFSRLVGQCSVS